MLLFTGLLSSCDAVYLFYHGASEHSSNSSYSPKAKELKKGEHILSGQVALNAMEYEPGDVNQNYGQLNYTFSYRLKYVYINMNASVGGGEYYFGNEYLAHQQTYYGYWRGGTEFGGYARLGSRFTWRYLQIGFGVGNEYGSYVSKLNNGQDELDERYPVNSVILQYFGPSMFNLAYSTELEYRLSSKSVVGVQFGANEESLAAYNGRGQFAYLYYEYGKWGTYYRMGPYMNQSTIGLYYRL